MIQTQNHFYNLEQLPNAAVEVRDGQITALNAAAQTHLPELSEGGAPPSYLVEPLESEQNVGSFVGCGTLFIYTKVPSSTGTLLLFKPAPESSLTPQQMDGFARQLREQMGSFLNNIQLLSDNISEYGQGEAGRYLSCVNRSFCLMLRLINNLEFLRDAESESGIPFRPVAMDLAGLCRQTAQEVGGLLATAGIQLRYQSQTDGLLIPGSPKLLYRMLLGLLSNAAKAASGHTISLSLRRWSDRAVLTSSNYVSTLDDSQLDILLRGVSPHQIPIPGEGAGMGLPIIRHIISLHGGAILMEQRPDGGLVTTVSLPTGPIPTQLEVCTPELETEGGISAALVELADVLPPSLFRAEDLE